MCFILELSIKPACPVLYLTDAWNVDEHVTVKNFEGLPEDKAWPAHHAPTKYSGSGTPASRQQSATKLDASRACAGIFALAGIVKHARVF